MLKVDAKNRTKTNLQVAYNPDPERTQPIFENIKLNIAVRDNTDFKIHYGGLLLRLFRP